ncbi:aromatic acid exporter family protein [Streptomyces sp. NPDC008141]|uniref:FUSC family protein n=1 Tax=Streptomyces sp. NPDC008141 TaxID=3364815 RepID=UPI0036EC729C
MAQEAGSTQSAPTRQGHLVMMAQWAHRAWAWDGQERHTVFLVGKSTLAATLAWVLSHDILHAQSPAFAPFSAVLIMQVTIYQSLMQCLRYIGAVVSGVAVQAALALLVGPDLITFVVVALIALIIGRWPRLGSQGTQVSTAAFFAFSTYTAATESAEKLTRLGEIILLVLIGCTVGIAVNLIVMPPLRHRSAEHAIHGLAQALQGLFGDMYPALRSCQLDSAVTERWRTRGRQATELAPQARAALRTAQESLYFNPRRFSRRHRGRGTFAGYGAVLAALERTLHQSAALARSLDSWHGKEDQNRFRPFLERYGDFLENLYEMTRVLSTLDENLLNEQSQKLSFLADEAQTCRYQLAVQVEHDALPLAEPSRPYGALVVEATRLMEEFQHTSDVLRQHIKD